MRFLSILIGITFILITLISCNVNKGSFLLINSAKEPISQALVSICGQTIELNDIQINKHQTGYYNVRSDSSYDIIVKFQSGKIIQKEAGYVTNGFDYQHEIIVTDTDIEVKAKLIGTLHVVD